MPEVTEATYSDLTPVLFSLLEWELLDYLLKSYCGPIFMTKGTRGILAQLLLLSYFCHSGNYEATCSDLTSVLHMLLRPI